MKSARPRAPLRTGAHGAEEMRGMTRRFSWGRRGARTRSASEKTTMLPPAFAHVRPDAQVRSAMEKNREKEARTKMRAEVPFAQKRGVYQRFQTLKVR